MDRQPGFTVVIDKAKLPELIHEMTDPRPGCADHLCQVFLIDPGNYSLGPALLAKMGQQQENPSQALFARIEKLVDEIRFVSDVAGEQLSEKPFRESHLFAEHSCYDQLLNSGKSAISHGNSRCHAQRLTGQASFTEELTGAQSGDNRFLAFLGCNRELHLASQDEEEGIRGLSLHEDGVVRAAL